jgi:hypothetical protein
MTQVKNLPLVIAPPSVTDSVVGDVSGVTKRIQISALLATLAGPATAAPTLTIVANAITPVTPIVFVGAGLIKNITVPSAFTGHGGVVTVLPTAAFTTDVTGNVAIASTAVVGRAMQFTYDGATTKWYPSY